MVEQITNLSVDLIDDPEVSARAAIDDGKLHDLSLSIKAVGVIQPILVKAVGERYEVIAGHRRLIAARMAQLPTIPVIVRDVAASELDLIKAHENLFRVDLNPVEEAVNIMRLHESYGWLEPEIARAMNMSAEWVSARVAILNYPDYMIEMIRDGDLGLGAAKWLFQIDDELVRKEYCRFAKLQGLTGKTAYAWYTSWMLGKLPPIASDYVPPSADGGEERKPLMLPCIACGSEDELMGLVLDYVHPNCASKMKQLVRDMQANERATEAR